MRNLLDDLFKNLGYNESNGLYILSNDNTNLNFPLRISRIIKDIIKPYAVFSLDFNNEIEHIKPLNNPLILFYNNPPKNTYEIIAKNAFNLSKASIIFINNGSNIDIFHGFNFSSDDNQWLSKIDVDHENFSIQNIRNGKTWMNLYDKYFKKTKTVDKYLLNNIIDCRRLLITENKFNKTSLEPEIANKLIGRILFIRYLIDRGVEFQNQNILIGNNKLERRTNFTEILNSQIKTYTFFEYISKKFKGDLFPLSFNGINEKDLVTNEHLKIIYNLLSCNSYFYNKSKSTNEYSIQQSLFNMYDFEIIPVELISNIYESFIGKSDYAIKENNLNKLTKQKEIQAYYTPSFIVDYIISQTVKNQLKNQPHSNCKVLDPSCGSGIFLVESLRQIIEKEIELSKNENLSNDKLWSLVQDNIYGIDIDPNAIEITIFSLYITLLDYKKFPKEIEEFTFNSLKGTNLFSGCDFFDTKNIFNVIFKNTPLDFIIGNPPWGKVKSSIYKDYIKDLSNKNSKIEIGGEEISQAFMLRCFDISYEKTKISFIITGKNFYNKNSRKWREYFLNNFEIIQFFDLFGVQNKLAGGHQLFENAKQPAVICTYKIKKNKQVNNNFKHIVARANQYFKFFKIILIEKNDVKSVNQNLIKKDDWLWKTLIYGNNYDYIFIKNLKLNYNFPLVNKNRFSFDNISYEYHGGYKLNDSSVTKKRDIKGYENLNYIEVDKSKDITPFNISSSKKFLQKLKEDLPKSSVSQDLKVSQLPNLKFFEENKLLIKKGLEFDSIKNRYYAVSAYTNKTVAFSSTIASIISSTDDVEKRNNFLYTLALIINSDFFIYYSLMTSSSFGADRNRVNFEEFLELPIVIDHRIIELSKTIHESYYNYSTHQIDNVISEVYDFNAHQNALIDYAVKISIPLMRRVSDHLYKPIDKKSINIIEEYAYLFYDHFSKRFQSLKKFFHIEAYINTNYISLNFKVTDSPKKVWISYDYDIKINDIITKIGNLSYSKIATELYFQQDVRGFNQNSFYIIKPNSIKNWHIALAYNDMNEFIEALTLSQLKN